MQSQDIQMRLDIHHGIGAPEGQGLEGAAPVQPPRGPSWEEAMPGMRVGGPSHKAEKRGGGEEGAWNGWEQPTHHHLLWKAGLNVIY